MGVEIEKEGSLRKIPVGRFPSALSGLFFTCRAHVLIGRLQTPTRAGVTCTDRPPVPWTLWALTWAAAIASTTRWRPWSSFADSPSLALPGRWDRGSVLCLHVKLNSLGFFPKLDLWILRPPLLHFYSISVHPNLAAPVRAGETTLLIHPLHSEVCSPSDLSSSPCRGFWGPSVLPSQPSLTPSFPWGSCPLHAPTPLLVSAWSPGRLSLSACV